MWKYIIIGAFVLLALVAWNFKSNHEAMVVVQGEVEALQSQYDEVVQLNAGICSARMEKEWAIYRTQYFEDMQKEYDHAKEEYVAATEKVKAETAAHRAQITKDREQNQDIVTRKDKALKGMASTVGVSEDSDDQSKLDAVREKVTDLVSKNTERKNEVLVLSDTLSAMKAATTALHKNCVALRQMKTDRQNRISPEKMECHVAHVDPDWEDVYLDAGVDKGIVVGSRLAVMRGDRKICELDVKYVYLNRTLCSIVYDTMLPGEGVQAGDKVIAVRNNK